MPRYRAKAPLFVDGILYPTGATFTSKAAPGRNWEPLDPPQTEPEPASKPSDGKQTDPAAKAAAVPHAVDIPAGWRTWNWMKQASLARNLTGGPFSVPEGQTQAEAAHAIIEAEETRRAEQGAA